MLSHSSLVSKGHRAPIWVLALQIMIRREQIV